MKLGHSIFSDRDNRIGALRGNETPKNTEWDLKRFWTSTNWNRHGYKTGGVGHTCGLMLITLMRVDQRENDPVSSSIPEPWKGGYVRCTWYRQGMI
jgi:hypothetical protein